VAIFEDLDPGTVALLLRDALAAEPCPVQDDQIIDVAVHTPLVESRARLLAELAGLPEERPSEQVSEPVTADVLQVKVSLVGARPPIWRRLEVAASMPLSQVHAVLQTAFGWDDAHLHRFETVLDPRAGRRGRGRILEGAALGRTRLVDVVSSPGDQVVYRYDFGDDWEHLVEVEARHEPVPGRLYPHCTAGRRAAPPEDCGGLPGFDYLLEALADPTHPEHDHLTSWTPAGYNAARFDLAAVNAALGADL